MKTTGIKLEKVSDPFISSSARCAQSRSLALGTGGCDGFSPIDLTTIGFDKLRMGQIAAEMLLVKISGKTVESVIVESNIIIERKSV